MREVRNFYSVDTSIEVLNLHFQSLCAIPICLQSTPHNLGLCMDSLVERLEKQFRKQGCTREHIESPPPPHTHTSLAHYTCSRETWLQYSTATGHFGVAPMGPTSHGAALKLHFLLQSCNELLCRILGRPYPTTCFGPCETPDVNFQNQNFGGCFIPHVTCQSPINARNTVVSLFGEYSVACYVVPCALL